MDAGYNSKAEAGDSLMVWMWSHRGEELRMTPRSLGQAGHSCHVCAMGDRVPTARTPFLCTHVHTQVCESPSAWGRH